MMRGGSQSSLSSASRSSPVRGDDAVPHVHERVGVGLAQVREVRGEVGRRLAHGLDRGDRDVAPSALLAEVAEVLLAVRRHLAQHRDALVAVLLQPADDERRVAAAVAVAQTEAVLARVALGAAPADERHLELVGVRPDDHRVVGAVGAGDADAPLVDQLP